MGNLPEINVSPIFEIDLKVLGRTVKYSPYTIAQEKAILTALESKETKEIINNYTEILRQCIRDEIVIEELSLVDFLNLVIAIRCKSSDEILSLQRKECSKCKKTYDFKVDLTKNIIYVNEDKRKDLVKVHEDLSIEIQPLKYEFLRSIDNIKDEVDAYVIPAAYSITKIIFKEKIYQNEDPEELSNKILANLSKKNLQTIFDAIKNLITIQLKIESVCPHCENKEIDVVNEFLKFLH